VVGRTNLARVGRTAAEWRMKPERFGTARLRRDLKMALGQDRKKCSYMEEGK